MSGSYLGLDAHCRSGLELAAVKREDGELLWRDRTPVNDKALLRALGRAPKPCTVVFEEGGVDPAMRRSP